jgi:hypothetical protein
MAVHRGRSTSHPHRGTHSRACGRRDPHPGPGRRPVPQRRGLHRRHSDAAAALPPHHAGARDRRHRVSRRCSRHAVHGRPEGRRARRDRGARHVEGRRIRRRGRGARASGRPAARGRPVRPGGGSDRCWPDVVPRGRDPGSGDGWCSRRHHRLRRPRLTRSPSSPRAGRVRRRRGEERQGAPVRPRPRRGARRQRCRRARGHGSRRRPRSTGRCAHCDAADGSCWWVSARPAARSTCRH